MNFNSIITKITIIFVFAIVLLIATFIFYLEFEKEKKYDPIVKKYEVYSKHFSTNKFRHNEIIDYLKPENFEEIRNPHDIIRNSKILIHKRGFEILLYKNSYYLNVLTPRFKLLLKDLTDYKIRTYSTYLFLMFLIVLIVIYFWLLKSLKPLSVLKQQISLFANGDLTVDCKSNKKDEIAEVSNEFDKAVRKIELLLNSRQLFLRTVMHELKTPIAKGRIVSELIEDEKQKNRMNNIFSKLDFLINDFSKVEQLVSKNYKINIHKYAFDIVFEKSIDMLLLNSDNERIDLNVEENLYLKVDIELFSIVFKNLIDNAFKYSSEKRIKIEQKEKKLLFISKGKKLSKPFESYFQAYHNETSSKNHGMGLGLYIVKTILDLHSMQFEYNYKNEDNIFIIRTV
jgi:two-component system OmpR family sensor kinase